MSTGPGFSQRFDAAVENVLMGATFGNTNFAKAASELGLDLRKVHVRECERVFREAVAPLQAALRRVPETRDDLANLERAIEVLERLEGLVKPAAARAPQAAVEIPPDTGRPGYLPAKQIPTGPIGRVLRRLLGEDDAATLIADWHSRGVSFPRSGRGAVDALSADLSDDRLATVICAMGVGRARRAGLDLTQPTATWEVSQTGSLALLSAPERRILKLLRDEGILTRNGALHISADEGRLRAYGRGLDDSPGLGAFVKLG